MAGTRPAPPDDTTPEFQAEALAEANALRARHHAPPLVLDPELTACARQRAASRSERKGLEAGHDGLRTAGLARRTMAPSPPRSPVCQSHRW